jgi:hypothetical protein
LPDPSVAAQNPDLLAHIGNSLAQQQTNGNITQVSIQATFDNWIEFYFGIADPADGTVLGSAADETVWRLKVIARLQAQFASYFPSDSTVKIDPTQYDSEPATEDTETIGDAVYDAASGAADAASNIFGTPLANLAAVTGFLTKYSVWIVGIGAVIIFRKDLRKLFAI